MQNDFRNNSYRLKGHDYSRIGAYFVTICTCDRKEIFGEILDGQMQLNDAGVFSQRCWQEIPQHFANVSLDEYVIMPNHVHGIIIVKPNNNDNNVGVQHVEPLQEPQRVAGYQRVIPGSVGTMVRGYKSMVTRWFRENTQIKTVWQRNFHDHIVRNEAELNQIRLYIRQNPTEWEFDRQNQKITKRVCESNTKYGYEAWMI